MSQATITTKIKTFRELMPSIAEGLKKSQVTWLDFRQVLSMLYVVTGYSLVMVVLSFFSISVFWRIEFTLCYVAVLFALMKPVWERHRGEFYV